MKIAIYFDSNDQTPVIYDLEPLEYKRLMADYQQYLDSGHPYENIYLGCVVKDGRIFRPPIHIALRFEDFALISGQ